MRKITEERAKELIIKGVYPKCKTSREIFQVVDSLEKLENLKRLSSVQWFELYEDDSINSLPENALDLSIDDAILLLADKEPVYCIKNGQTQTISNQHSLMDIIRTCNVRGEQFVLYWLVT